jgi:hypothetical protein
MTASEVEKMSVKSVKRRQSYTRKPTENLLQTPYKLRHSPLEGRAKGGPVHSIPRLSTENRKRTISHHSVGKRRRVTNPQALHRSLCSRFSRPILRAFPTSLSAMSKRKKKKQNGKGIMIIDIRFCVTTFQLVHHPGPVERFGSVGHK